VLHAKVVAHLVGDSGGQETNDIAVPHVDATRELVGADGPFQRLADNAAVESDAGEQLGIVVGIKFDLESIL
jgi:hypothetical protein